MSEEEKVLKIEVVRSNFFIPQQSWVLKPGEYTLGRFPTNDIVIPDPYVSRRHARLFYKDGRWFIEDLGSTNGTIVDNEDLRGKEPRELKDGSEIVVGLTILKTSFVKE